MFSSANLFLFLNAKHNTLDHLSRFAPTCTTHKEEECLVASYTKPGRVICIVSDAYKALLSKYLDYGQTTDTRDDCPFCHLIADLYFEILDQEMWVIIPFYVCGVH